MKKILCFFLILIFSTKNATALINHLAGSITARDTRQNWTGQFTIDKPNANNYQIRLFGPAGAGSVIITKQNGIVSFNDGKKILKNHDPKILMKQITGIAIPLDTVIKILFSNKIHHLENYKIEYLKTREIQGKWFPEKIRVSNDQIIVKLAISNFGIKDMIN